MAATTSDFTVVLSDEERRQMRNLLEQVLRDKLVEVHRTEASDYRAHLERQVGALRRVFAKLGAA
jgi:hypothetical protein